MMNEIKKWATKCSDALTGDALLRALQSLHANQPVAPASLAINGAGNAAAKTTNAAFVLVNGITVKIAAAQVMPVLTGVSIPNGSKQAVGFCTDVSGNLSLIQGAVAATIGGVTFPKTPENTVALGYLVIENASGAAFTGGTTALDAGGGLVVTYVNQVDGFEPLSIL